MKNNKLLLFILFLLTSSVALAQLDPLPGDPLPGDPGIEVPLDNPIVLALLLIAIVLIAFFVKRKRNGKKLK
jgi:4-hydroxybenzoate polyprenyltransferase